MSIKRFSLAIVASLPLLTSCSKDANESAPTAGGSTLEFNETLSALEPQTLGFVVWDTKSPGFAQYEKSAWHQMDVLSSVEKEIAALSDEEQASIKRWVSALRTSGLYPAAGQPELVSRGLAFASLSPDGKKLQFAALGRLTDASKADAALAALAKASTESGLTATPLSGSPRGFVLDLSALLKDVKESEAREMFHKFWVLTDGATISLSNDETVARDILTRKDSKEIEAIRQSPSFAKIVGGLRNRAGEFQFSYVAVDRMIDIFAKKIAPSIPAAEGEEAMNPEEIIKVAEQIPLDGMAINRSMGDGLESQARIGLTPKTDTQRAWEKAAGGATSDLSKVSSLADAAITISVSVDLLNKLMEVDPALMQGLPPESVAWLKTVHGVSLIVRSQGASGPFPEIALAFQGDNVDGVKSFADGMLQNFAQPGGFLMPPQSHSVDGIEVTSSISPFAVGIHMGEKNGKFVLASAERPVLEMLKSDSGSSANELPASVKQQLSQGSTKVLAQVRFDKLATLIEQTQGNLAMFTGGQQMVQAEKIQNMKQLGTVSTLLKYEGGVIDLQSVSTAPAVAAAN